MGENPDDPKSITMAASFTSIRADWLMNEEIGLEFLQEMLRQKRRDLFETPYIKMATHFLYKNYSAKIFWKLLPTYIVHLVSIIAYIAVSEAGRDHERDDVEKSDESSAYLAELVYLRYIFLIITGIASAINLMTFFRQTINLGI